MKRFIFAVALAGITTSSTHAIAQERVATRSTTSQSARTATAAHAEMQPKTPAPGNAATPTKSGDGSTLVAPTQSSVVVDHPGQNLADVRGHGTTSTGSGAEATSIAVVVAASKVPRMIATPRLLRRINADVVVAKLATAFRACYAEDPAEKTAESAVVRVEVAASGAVDRASVESGAKTTPQNQRVHLVIRCRRQIQSAWWDRDRRARSSSNALNAFGRFHSLTKLFARATKCLLLADDWRFLPVAKTNISQSRIRSIEHDGGFEKRESSS